ncbi:Hsp70 family protein, partial [Mycobacterium talmoniae]
MYDPLGLSIGNTNLVAVRVGESPVTRRSMLTLFPHRDPEIGAPEQNPALTESGPVVTGFVQRVGDPVPLAASDGSVHDPSLLLVEAIDAMVNATGADATTAQLALAVPAHWGPAARARLQDALATHAGLSTLGGPAQLVSDATAALTALRADCGLPNRGVIALLDFGGSGTSITLADAGAGFQPIDETRRYAEFSGDRIDDALLAHVMGSIGDAGGVDPSATAAVGQLAELREECTQAKERLSAQQATDLVADLPGAQLSVRVTRDELQKLIEDPLSGLICALEDMLERNTIRWSKLAAVATVGGGASIPVIAQRLSSRRRMPVVTSQHPALDIAVGAAVMAARGADEEGTTRVVMAAADTQTQTALAASPGTSTGMGGLPPVGGLDEFAETAPRKVELAWSQEDDADEPVPYVGDPYTVDVDRPVAPYEVPSRLPEVRRGSGLPRLVFAVGALLAAAAIGGVAYTLANSSHTEAPTTPTNT